MELLAKRRIDPLNVNVATCWHRYDKQSRTILPRPSEMSTRSIVAEFFTFTLSFVCNFPTRSLIISSSQNFWCFVSRGQWSAISELFAVLLVLVVVCDSRRNISNVHIIKMNPLQKNAKNDKSMPCFLRLEYTAWPFALFMAFLLLEIFMITWHLNHAWRT